MVPYLVSGIAYYLIGILWKLDSVVSAGVCMRGYLMWTCLVWAERPTPEKFWVPSHRFNSATGEPKGIGQTIYTDSEPPSWMPNSLTV